MRQAEALSAVMKPQKEYCMQKQHFVEADKMTLIWCGKVRRRVCENCQSDIMDRREKEKRNVSHLPV